MADAKNPRDWAHVLGGGFLMGLGGFVLVHGYLFGQEAPYWGIPLLLAGFFAMTGIDIRDWLRRVLNGRNPNGG